jgi:hypothetical protein
MPNYANISARIHEMTTSLPGPNNSDILLDALEPPLRVPLPGRGWLDLSLERNSFEPFNVTEWEMKGLLSLKEDLERRDKEVTSPTAAKSDERTAPTDPVPSPIAGSSASATTTSIRDAGESPKRRWLDLFMFSSFKRSYTVGMPDATAPPEPGQAPSQPALPSPVQTGKLSSNLTETVAPLARANEPKLPRLRREYDLRPYGIDLVIDFGWSRSAS